MKKLLKTKIAVLLGMMFRLVPLRLLLSLFFKAAFIAMQISAIWLIISWIGGHPLMVVRNVVNVDAGSYVYLIIAAAMLVLAAVFSFMSRVLALQSVKRMESYIFSLSAGGAGLAVSDLRNLSKFMVSIIDSLMPVAFIVAVVVAWIFVMPIAIVPVVVLMAVVLFAFKKAIGFAARTFQAGKRAATPADYIGSSEHRKFYRTLMVPQYISLVSYMLIAVGIVVVLLSVRALNENSVELGFLPVASALALLQFKSFAVLLVRYGAYYRNVDKVLAVLGHA